MTQLSDARTSSSPPSFPQKQGQYFAFTQAYTLVNGRPPAEADMPRFFRVIPPSVHQVITGLAKADLIDRKPGTPQH